MNGILRMLFLPENCALIFLEFKLTIEWNVLNNIFSPKVDLWRHPSILVLWVIGLLLGFNVASEAAWAWAWASDL